jgi:hypothetical protein
MGVPPWAPLGRDGTSWVERGAHGGTPIQVFINNIVTGY